LEVNGRMSSYSIQCAVTKQTYGRDSSVPAQLLPTYRFEDGTGGERQCAFTLIEMLVVIGIIGILTAISLPAMKGIGQANVTAAATRQMLDDLHYARLRAISDRTTAYVVFTPTNVARLVSGNLVRPEDRRVLSNLVSHPYGSYAVVSTRSVGDQPGQFTPRYLTEWKTLPEGILIPQAKFARDAAAPRAFGAPFSYGQLPFPKARSPLVQVPFIAFNSLGQLIK